MHGIREIVWDDFSLGLDGDGLLSVILGFRSETGGKDREFSQGKGNNDL